MVAIEEAGEKERESLVTCLINFPLHFPSFLAAVHGDWRVHPCPVFRFNVLAFVWSCFDLAEPPACTACCGSKLPALPAPHRTEEHPLLSVWKHSVNNSAEHPKTPYCRTLWITVQSHWPPPSWLYKPEPHPSSPSFFLCWRVSGFLALALSPWSFNLSFSAPSLTP